MVLWIKENADKKQLDNLVNWLESAGIEVHAIKGKSRTLIGLIGDLNSVDVDLIRGLDIVESVVRIS